MRRICLIIFLLFLVLVGFAIAQSDKPLLLRNPSLSQTQIAFSFAGDIWLVGREGGKRGD